ncbi:MAG: phytanoyl-CoA dioxygenase family protein [Verrucomicrobiota bacterium]|jgi:hypothetical protein|nr:phytanoyl-CoA dioxygenase family protein [Verrucomicrobiota bacterium]
MPNLIFLRHRETGYYLSRDGRLKDEVFDTELFAPSTTRHGFDAIVYEELMPSQLLAILQLNGWVLAKFFTQAEVTQLKQPLATEIESTTDTQVRLGDLVARDAAFAHVITHPVLLAILRREFGTSIRCSSFSSNTLLPQIETENTVLGWHVDYPYHDLKSPWQVSPTLGIQVLTLLDEFTSENGGTLFRTHSVQRAHWPTYGEFSTPGKRGRSQCEQLGRQIHHHPHIKQFHPADAGDCFIMHSACWHRQMPNCSESPRTALLANYVPSTMRPKDRMEFIDYPQFTSRDRETLRELYAPFVEE